MQAMSTATVDHHPEEHPVVDNDELLLPFQQPPPPPSATGRLELDTCLGHHLQRAKSALETIARFQDTPLGHPVEQMVARGGKNLNFFIKKYIIMIKKLNVIFPVEAEETVALESLLAIHEHLPLVPNVQHCELEK
jgi:hypothetical protein